MAFKEETLQDGRVSMDGRNSAQRIAAKVSAAAASAAEPRVWVGSVLVVTKAPVEELVVTMQDETGNAVGSPLPPTLLEMYHDWNAVRFMIRVPVAAQQTKVNYGVSVSGQKLKPQEGEHFHFYIAGYKQPAHWGYYSCSGFSLDVPAEKREKYWGGMKPLWEDVKKVHEKKPLHLLVGGGDQLYNDDVWTVPELKPFLDMSRKTPADRDAKQKAEFTDSMRAAVGAYYFHHYAVHFAQPIIADMYALVPQVMSWVSEGVDIFDGWGSYPPYLQSSAVFKGIFDLANTWYSVFQQHCTKYEKPMVSIYELGGSTAVVTCDQRHRRLRDQILPLEHYMRLTMLCTNLPPHVRHVVIVFTVPVVYPHIRGGQKILSCLSTECMSGMLAKLGVSPMNHFNEPELMDDLDDHWTARSHQEERRFLIEHLQMLARYRGCRVTLLSGDVHVCGAGHLYSHPTPPTEQGLLHDYRYMPQIVSSAIANPPPPSGLMKVLEYFSRPGKINKYTSYRMDRIIKNAVGVGKILENKRNWCEVLEHDANDPVHPSYLTFRLRVEEDPGNNATLSSHDYPVAPLEPATPGHDDYFDPRSVHIVRKACSCVSG
ncbi:hypothetical protein HXX76_013323 [Chlamydomonas incerta]|uniref:PhoD-like phosphatase domain-containing protein n=1 Tax=Chlamydomonas incerta TaxID=51695 RepID=A0A835VSA9_CHLIN|nr:hypothetical protein HXX76_013323 [Chlamydomonas incerta]|eukprot:KAG2425950.1 hypothetical protein HXX76_013323 [Chlamydomonas incerta]